MSKDTNSGCPVFESEANKIDNMRWSDGESMLTHYLLSIKKLRKTDIKSLSDGIK